MVEEKFWSVVCCSGGLYAAQVGYYMDVQRAYIYEGYIHENYMRMIRLKGYFSHSSILFELSWGLSKVDQ